MQSPWDFHLMSITKVIGTIFVHGMSRGHKPLLKRGKLRITFCLDELRKRTPVANVVLDLLLEQEPAQNLHNSCTQRRNLTPIRKRKALNYLEFFGATRRSRTTTC
jgi:hypothetical protein